MLIQLLTTVHFCLLVSQKSNPIVSTKEIPSFRNQAAGRRGRRDMSLTCFGKIHIIGDTEMMSHFQHANVFQVLEVLA